MTMSWPCQAVRHEVLISKPPEPDTVARMAAPVCVQTHPDARKRCRLGDHSEQRVDAAMVPVERRRDRAVGGEPQDLEVVHHMLVVVPETHAHETRERAR